MKKIYFFLLLLVAAKVTVAQNCTVNAGVPITYCPGETMNLYGNVTGTYNAQSITWSQVSGPAVTIANTHSLVTACGTATSGATYVFRISSTCGDGITSTNDVTYTVTNVPAPPAANAGTDISAGCKAWGSSIALNATPAPAGFQGTWTIVSGGTGTFDNANSPTANFTPTQLNSASWTCPSTSNTYTLRWTLRSTGGPFGRCQPTTTEDDVIINAAMYNTPVDAVAVPPGCGNPTNNVFLYGSCPGTGTIAWSLVSGPAGYTFAGSSSKDVTLTAPPVGTYTFRYTVTAGCVSGTKDVTFSITGINYAVTAANANAGNMQTYYCDNLPSTLILAANQPATGETGVWTQVGGGTAVSFANPNSPSTQVSGLTKAGAPYTFRWTITNTYGCSSISSISIGVYTNLDPSPLTTNYVYCGADLGGSFNTRYCGGPIPSMAYQAVQTFYTGGLGRWHGDGWRLRGSTLIQQPAGMNFSTAYMKSYGAPEHPIGQTYIDDTTCPSKGDYHILAYNNNNFVTFSLSSDAELGTYSFILEFYNIFCGKVVTIPWTISFAQSVTASNAGTDQQLLCGTTNTNLAANNPLLSPPKRGVGKWQQMDGPNTAVIADVYDRSTLVSGLIPGTYTFRWFINSSAGANSTCTDNYDDVLIRVSDTPPTDITAGSDATLCYGSPTTLTADLVPSGNLQNMLNSTGSIGTWSLVSQTPAGTAPTIVSPSAVSTSVTGLVASTVYVFRFTASNLCGSKTDDVTITTNATQGPSQANAGVNTCLASGISTVSLSATAPTSGTGTWTKLNAGNPGTISNPTLRNTTVTGVTPNGIYGYVWTVSTGGGCADTKDTVYISNQGTTVTAANAGADQSICATAGSNTFTLTGNTPTNGTGRWEQVSGPVQAIFNPNTASTVVTATAEGIYKFRWVISNGVCTDATDEVVVNLVFRPDPAVVTTADATLCPADGSTISLNALSPGAGTGSWSVVSGSASLNSYSSPSTTATLTGAGPAVFRWNVSASNAACPSTYDEVVIKKIIASNAGSDASFCRATAAVLDGSHSGTGTSGSWNVLSQPGGSPAVTITPMVADSIASASPLVAGQYTFRYTVNTGTCPTTTDDVVVTIDDVANPDAGADMCGISGTAISLTGSAIPAGATATWTRFSAPSGAPAGTFTNATTANATYTITPQTSFTPGTYNFQYQITKGACQIKDYVAVRVVSKPNAGTDIKVCNDATGNFTLAGTALTAAGESGLWTYNGGSPTITSPTLNNSGVTGVNVGDSVNFIWTVSAPGSTGTCVAKDTVSIVNRTQQTANASAAASYCDDAAGLSLTGSSPGNGTGSWSVVSKPAGSPAVQWLTGPNSQNATVRGMTMGNYVFRYTITQTPCAASTKDVTVSSTCFILPVKFEYFNAGKVGTSQVRLDWKSQDAGEVVRYEIERSVNGANWQNIGLVIAGASDVYSYFDNVGTQGGTFYYRIKATELTGAIRYTEVRLVKFGGSAGVQIYPTVTGGVVNVLSSAADLKQVRLLQADGKELLRRQLVATQGIQIDISGYAKGTYIIEAITTGGRKVQKVVKM